MSGESTFHPKAAVGVSTMTSPAGSEKKAEKPKKYIAQYELGKTLGAGSYAKVKYCTDTDTGDVFAVKIFNKSLLKRRRLWDSTQSKYKTAFDDVLKEIAIMRKLNHENVLNMRDVIDDSTINKLYMVMDFCRRGAVMDSANLPCAPLDFNDCRRWFADVVVGLDYLHFQGVVHFDLKPDNILVAEDGRAVIADFGVSRMLSDQANEQADKSREGYTSGSPGTPSFTAPEVWGAVKYHGKLSDVWSLGVTLHAMVFGTLPFYSLEQQELIAMVTAAGEWQCAHVHEDDQLLDVLRGMICKDVSKRSPLSEVKQHPWVACEMASRDASLLGDWEQIVVSEQELAEAVISGHVANFRRDRKKGTLMKMTAASEADMYRKLHDSISGISKFLPQILSVKAAPGKRVILEMQDLTHNLEQPCMMDIKMGVRTFHLKDAAASAFRDDLLQKMLKVDANAATPEDLAAGGVTKLRYLRFREASTTTKELGFRIDALQLAHDVTTSDTLLDVNEIRTSLTSSAEAADAICAWVQRRQQLLSAFLAQLLSVRDAVERCDVCMSHALIRTSLLFIYSNATNSIGVYIIDLAQANDAGSRLTHRDAWVEHSHEEGYLTGLDNLILIFQSLLEEVGGYTGDGGGGGVGNGVGEGEGD